MNPIFAHQARSLLSGAQRLLRKTVLYYALPPEQPPPDVLDVMTQVSRPEWNNWLSVRTVQWCCGWVRAPVKVLTQV
jgi:hypothetical protein